MLVELVQTRTDDGIRLDGALQEAVTDATRSDATRSPAIDGALCLSGVGSNFYGSTLVKRLGQALVEHGVTVLYGNTRGHDGISTASTAGGGLLQGAAYETVDDCRLDVAAWVRLLQDRGCQHIALIGHSLGAIKVVYAQSLLPQAVVDRVVAISPPRLAYSRFVRGRDAEAFLSSLATAQTWMDEAQPTTLFQATFPFPLVISARTFCDKYGPAERYNFLHLADRLQAPVDFIYGQRELDSNSSAFDQIVPEIQEAAWASEQTVEIIPDANHFYSGCLTELIQVVIEKVV